MRKCIQFKNTESGLRCARYEESDDLAHAAGFGFKDITSAIKAPLRWEGKGLDVLLGAVAGLFGGVAAKWVLSKVGDKIPVSIMPYVAQAQPLIGGALAATALYYGQKKSARAKAHAVGALAIGTALTAWDLLRKHFPQLNGVVLLPEYQGYGLLQEDYARGMGGLIVDEPRAGMAELAAMSMADDEDNFAGYAAA